MSPRPRIKDEIGQAITQDDARYRNKTAKYLAVLRHDLRRLRDGLCGRHGCKAMRLPDNQYCQVHRDASRDYQRKYYLEKKIASNTKLQN